MSPGILGKKIGMTQVFRPDGQVVPVTVLKAGPCIVVQRKTPASDGYDAVQLGFMEYAKKSGVSKPRAGHFKKSGAEGTYQKSKVDRQVISVAKAWNAEAIYTTDRDVVNMAKSIGGIIGVAIWDLPLPTDADAAALDVPPSPTTDFTTGDLFSSSDFEPLGERSPDAEPET